MNALMKSILDTPCPSGTAVGWWLGQMGLMVKLEGILLCVDYFATDTPSRRFPPSIPAGEVEGVDVFLGTHDHSDHIDHPAWRIWAKTCPDARFVFPAAHRRRVLDDGIRPDNCIGLNDMECCRTGGVTVRAVAAAHEFLSRDPETGLYPCLQYVIEGGGVRIYHAGDTLRYDGMLAKIRSFGPVDAALVPINGRDAKRYKRNCIGNMTFQEAVDLTGELRPRCVIPSHWDMFKDNPGDPDAFADYLDAKYPGQVRCLRPARCEPFRIGAGSD